MADASRCPECRGKVHPYAASCPSCGADLDAYRRRRAQAPRRQVRLPVPSAGTDWFDLVALALILLVLAVFAPLIGALFALFVVWHSHHHGNVGRRNVACVCAALALINLFAPRLIEPLII